MSAHPSLQPPLPQLSRSQTPTTLSQLVHFIQTTYTQTNHPDKFAGWLKGLLDKVLDLDEVRGVGTGAGAGAGGSATVGDVGGTEDDEVQAQTQGQGQIPSSSTTPDQTIQNPNLPQRPQRTQSHSQPTPTQPQTQNQTQTQTQNQNSTINTQQAPKPKAYRLPRDEFDFIMEYHPTWASSTSDPDSGLGGHGGRGQVDEVMGGIGLVLLYILAKHLQSPHTIPTHPISLITFLSRLLTSIEEKQLSSCSEALCLVVRGLKGMGKLHRLPDHGLDLMQRMIGMIVRHSPGSLSGGHATFVETAYVAGRPEVALPLLDVPIEDVSYYKLHPTDFLLYHFYGAMIHLDRRDWEQAREYLELTVSTPADVASPLQVEAHCKLVLVNLIIEGKPFSYPAYLSPAVSKAIREQGKAYEPIVEGFSSRNAAVMWTINKEEFAKDNNVPLIDEVQRAFLEWQVRDMTKIYSKMYLDDVAQRLFAKDGQGRISDQEIEGIIDDLGKLHAQISADQSTPPRSFVTFFDNPEDYRSKETVAKLNEMIKQSRETAVLALERDKQMCLHDEWLGKIIKKNEDMSILSGGASEAGLFRNKAPGVLKGVGSNWNDVGF